IRPMVYRADLGVSQDLSRHVGGAAHGLQVRLDMLNFTNWLNKNWGVSQLLITNRPLASQGVDATGANLYRLNTLSTGGPLISKSFQKAVTVNDVWRMQLGVRYMFNWSGLARPARRAKPGGAGRAPPAPGGSWAGATAGG